MNNPGLDVEFVAQQVGAQGVDNLVANAERICTYEQQRITHTNEPEIVRLGVTLAIEVAEERRIAHLLQMAPPLASPLRLRLRAIYYWSVVVILAVAGFFSTVLSFAPFQLGWMSWLVSGGMAVLTPFLVDRLLDSPGTERLVKLLTAIAATASLASLMLLALIRGDLLAHQIHESEAPAAVVDDAQPQPEAPGTFYDQTAMLLQLALFLMAFAMESGAGLVLHEAWRSIPDDSAEWQRLRRQLVEVRERMAEIVCRSVTLRKEPDVFVARFWRDFYRTLLLSATRNAMTKLLFVLITILAVAAPCAHAQDRLNLVIAIDLSQSVAATGPDGKTDFQKNVEGVSRLLGQIPASSRVKVIGITGHSFTEPYILLSARVPNDSGYFGERLNAARGQILRAWKERSGHLHPDSRQTDILGAVDLASQIFAQRPDATRNMFVIFSDMRQSTPCLDLEAAKVVPALDSVKNKCGEIPSVRDVEVYVEGADGAGRSAAYWQSLRNFWTDYFHNTGAAMKDYAVLRELNAFDGNQR
jgi:hypothetical protein